jgi:nucleoside-diphosphate-sugar epimerase
MKKILVTGATGFIGFEVSKQLAGMGLHPRVMVRRPLRGIFFRHYEVEGMQADLIQPQSLERLLEGVDTVIHLGGRATFDPYYMVAPSLVQGSLNVMEASIQAGVKRFVFGGSLLVYGDRADIINQDTPPQPIIAYAKAKLKAETLLYQMAQQAGISFISLRLPHVYGVNSLLFNEIRRGQVIFPGSGNKTFAHLHVHDCARALIRATQIETQGIYAIADDQPSTWNELFAVVQIYYPGLRVIHLPYWVALLGTYFLKPIMGLSKLPNRYAPDAVISWNKQLVVEKQTLSNILEMDPKFPSIGTGIPHTLDQSIPFSWQHSKVDPTH